MAVTNYYTMNGQIVGESTSGVRTAYHRDALGSVVATTDQNQSVTATARCAAYGTAFATSGNYAALRFGWCGTLGYRKTQRSGIGLVQSEAYVRARHYSASASRWTTTDPADEDGNLYGYGESSPVTLVDPTGMLSSRMTSNNFQTATHCGDVVNAEWTFTLSKPAPCKGWIVQKVDVTCSYQACTCPTNPSSWPFSYWEAWPIAHGGTTAVDDYGWNTGTWATGTCHMKSGQYGQTTTIKFFCQDADPKRHLIGVGDLSQQWHQHFFGPPNICNTWTGSLPGTSTKPSWWDSLSVDGIANRGAWTGWSCCDKGSDYVKSGGY